MNHSHLTLNGFQVLHCRASGGSTGVVDKPRNGTAKEGLEGEPEEETYYDAMKKDMAARASKTKSALESLAPHQRIAMEGFRPGTYLRLRFTGQIMPRPNLHHGTFHKRGTSSRRGNSEDIICRSCQGEML